MATEEKTHLNIEEINRKDRFTGTVVKTMLAGAIIDIGLDAPGILHISQLQEEPVNKVEDVLEVGKAGRRVGETSVSQEKPHRTDHDRAITFRVARNQRWDGSQRVQFHALRNTVPS